VYKSFAKILSSFDEANVVDLMECVLKDADELRLAENNTS